MESSLFDIDGVRFWLEFLHGDSRGFIHVCSTGDWSGRTFDLQDNEALDTAIGYVKELDNENRQGIYLRMTTIPQVAEGRGKDEDSISFPGLWADIDLAGPGHKTDKPLPGTREDAENIVREAGLPDPTLWVHSGGGLYPYWLLRQPYNINQDQHKVRAIQELSAGWQRCLGEAAERLGMFYGTQCGDLSRVLRIPGTVNRKAGLERPCQVLEATGRSYDLAELVQAFSEASGLLKPAETPLPRESLSNGTSPFDVFEANVGWEDEMLLGGIGWQVHHIQGNTIYWVRSGKRRIDGHSATTGRAGDRDRLWMFSDADTHVPAGGPYTKGYVYSLIHHNGNMSAAAKHLKSLGYGGTPTEPLPDTLRLGQSPPLVPQKSIDLIRFSNDDIGNGERMQAKYGHKFRYITDSKKWAYYNGKHWEVLHNADKVKYHAAMLSREMKREADAGDPEDEFVKALQKWAKVSTANARTEATVANFRMQPGVSVTSHDFDKDSRYIGVQNGVLDLGAELTDVPTLLPASPELMVTKVMGASYLPEQRASRFEKFMEEVLPDRELRDFVQRLCGYALLGKPSYRAMAILSGPPRSGKSKFIEAINHAFGDYGGTAAASLFRSKRDGSSPTVDLHYLRGKRFVATSESSESAIMDEELIKRVTGMDKVNSRGLYESPQEWLPHFVLFMATNHHPRVNPEDNATWDRLKVVRFEQEFRGDGDDPFLLDKLMAETDGILNWLLEGLRLFRLQGGLSEPESVTEAGTMYRRENDTVSQFVDAAVEDQILYPDPEGEIPNTRLYEMYEGWCVRNKVGPALGNRKFSRRLESLGFQRTTTRQWTGLKAGAGTHGILGSMG